MSLHGETLFLQPNLHDKKVDLNTVLDTWDEARRYSVEVAFTHCTATNAFEFAANECIFFASINQWLVQSSQENEADMDNDSRDEELIDYEDENDIANGAPAQAQNGAAASNAVAAPAGGADADKDKKNYTGIHATGFRDFLSKPEPPLRAISDFGFEHESEGGHSPLVDYEATTPPLAHPGTSLRGPSRSLPTDAAIWSDKRCDGTSDPENTPERKGRHLVPLPLGDRPQAVRTRSDLRLSETVGIIYLAPGQFESEVNVGLALAPAHRGKGLGKEAVSVLMKWVFDVACYHRVQVALMEGPGRDRALKLFTSLGFVHEGTRRRQVFSTFSREYRDVTYMAIVDTEWSVRNYFKHSPNSLWDELFQRHQREMEELLRWESGYSKLKRTQSMETVRMALADESAASSLNSARDDLKECYLAEMTDQANLEPRGDFEYRQSVFSAALSLRSRFVPADSPGPEESWDMASEHSADWLAIESQQATQPPIHPDFQTLFGDGGSPPIPPEFQALFGDDDSFPRPPPSEASNSSGWEVASASSTSNWDKCSVISSSSKIE